MKSIRFFATALSYLVLLATSSQAITQAELEVRKAQPKAGAAIVETRAAGSNTGDNYQIRSNDQLEIRVFGQSDMSGVSVVREDGTVRLNLLQEAVSVSGLTLSAVESRIRGLLANGYLRDPRVSVQISRHATMRVTVMGRVNQPRTLPIPSNTPVTLVQAIGMAGGKTSLGNLKKVYLKRGNAVQILDVEEMMRNSGTQSIELQDGDVIDVPEKLW